MRDKLWMSPGAALGLTIVCCIFVLGMAFVALPAAQKAKRAEERQTAAEVQREQGQKQGVALLHRFDCTYGRATQLALQNAEKTARQSALLSKRNAKALTARHLRSAARVALQAYRNQARAADDYRKLLLTLKPLGPKLPCP